MEIASETENSNSDLHYWERAAQACRLAAYMSEIETAALIRAHQGAAKVDTLLDFGCGGGRFAQFMALRGWNPICMDVDPQAVGFCRKRLPQSLCCVLDKDASAIPLRDASLGMIVCIGVPVISKQWFAREVERTLVAGGLLVGKFHNKWSYRGLADNLRGAPPHKSDWYDVAYPRWRRNMQASGFEVIHEQGYGWPPFNRTSDSRLIPSAIRLEHVLGLDRAIAVSPFIAFVMRKHAP